MPSGSGISSPCPMTQLRINPVRYSIQSRQDAWLDGPKGAGLKTGSSLPRRSNNEPSIASL